MIETKNHSEIGKQVIHKEIKELIKLESELGLEFDLAVESIRKIEGKVIVTGIGKSGHIARKISATLSSTGTPSIFMHPAEACHGDIGMIRSDDILVIISYSGGANEIITLLPIIKRNNIKIICLSGNKNSILAKNSNHFLSIKVTEEACPLGLAPTSSTTKTLALGDAIAVALLKSKDFKRNDFAISHPAGSLGRNLLTTAKDLMHIGSEIPLVSKNTLIADAIVEMSSKGFGTTGITDENNKIIGIYTDGDLRRTLENKINIHNEKVAKVMTCEFKMIQEQELATAALAMMQGYKISSLFTFNKEHEVAGIIHIHDILGAGIG